jgi:hypothetical protein
MSTGSAIRKRSRSMTDVAFRERASESAAVAAMEPAKRRNISLDVDLDSDSGTAYTSASQYSGETNVEHLPELADFVKAVAEGVSRVVFPRPQRPYATVHALMISWEEDDLRTEHEISNLRKTFEKTYGYTTNHYKIPSSDSPEFDLDLVLSQTNYHHGRNKDGLLIIYYGGHGELEKRTSHAIWKAWLDSTSAPRSPRSPQLNWSDVQSTAMKAKGDILFILDCCYASGALRTAHNPYRGHTTRRELLLASGNEKASTQNSLTKAIICELDELRGSPCTISSLHSSLLQNQPEHGLKPTPIFTCMAGASAGISLVPLPDPATSAHPDGQSMITPKADLAQLTSECRVLISVALVELGGPSMYKAWVEWFRDHAPPNVAGISIEQIIKPEAVHKGNSYHMVFSIPVSVWNSMTPHPAINFVSFIRSGNLISAENSDLSGDHGAIQLRLRELLGTSSYTDLNQMLRQENETLRARIKVLETAPDSNTALDKEEKLHIPLRPKDALHDAETPDQSDAEVPPTLKDSTLGDNPRTALLVPDSSRPERRVRPKHPIAPSSPKGDPPVLSHGSKSGDDHVKSKDAPKETIGALVGGTTLLERMMGRRSKAMGKARDQSGPTTRHGPVQSLSSSTTPVSGPLLLSKRLAVCGLFVPLLTRSGDGYRITRSKRSLKLGDSNLSGPAIATSTRVHPRDRSRSTSLRSTELLATCGRPGNTKMARSGCVTSCPLNCPDHVSGHTDTLRMCLAEYTAVLCETLRETCSEK